MTQGISGFGATLSGATFGTVGQITKLSLPGIDAGEIDVTTMDSVEKWKEFIASLKDAGELSVDVLYTDSQYGALLDAIGGDNEDWTITLPDGATFVCAGFLKSVGGEVPMDGAIANALGIRLSGKPTFTEPSA